MRTKVSKRTRTALGAGLALLIAGGGGAIYLGTNKAPPAAAAVAKANVYYAATAIGSGTAATTALAEGAIRVKSVVATDRPANAVGDPSQLAGRVATTTIPVGSIITADMFPDPQTRIGTVVIPPGKRALALELAPVAGVAGFAGAGDRIDVFAVSKAGEGAVRLVLQGVEVLNVNGVGLTAAQGQPGSPNLIYLLAVTPGDAERLIYLHEFEKMYFDLVPKNEPPVKTPGAAASGVLAV
jgi:Flp pilus assembly protein CpaB